LGACAKDVVIIKSQKGEVKMSILPSEQLKEQITSIPSELQKALEQQAKARMAVAHLEAQISKLEVEIERAGEEEDNDTPDYDGLEDNLELLRMESAVERLKLKVTEAEDKAEIAFRKTTEKITEALVKAALGTNPTVIELRNKLLDAKEAAKERKVTLQNERMKAREAKLEAMYSARKDTSPEYNKLFELQEKLSTAEDALTLADIEVEVVRAKIETYKMLVHLENRA
jgi:chromosome segregation ATPase